MALKVARCETYFIGIGLPKQTKQLLIRGVRK